MMHESSYRSLISRMIVLLSSFFLISHAELSFTRLGGFSIQWDIEDPFFMITTTSRKDPMHKAAPGHVEENEEKKILFRTLPNWPFLTVGYAASSKPPIESGNFKINEWILYETPHR